MRKAQEFPEFKEFDDNWQAIRTEMEQYIYNNWDGLPSLDDIDAAQRELIENDNHKWKVLMVKMYGQYLNTGISPTLTALIQKYDDLIPTATISCMAPKKYIPPHTGPNKTFLRYTLPLRVPKGGECYLVVDGQKIPLEEGNGVFWDDTYMHEALNDTDGIRIALLLDVKRDMPQHLNRFYEWLLRLGRKTKRFKEASETAMVPEKTV